MASFKVRPKRGRRASLSEASDLVLSNVTAFSNEGTSSSFSAPFMESFDAFYKANPVRWTAGFVFFSVATCVATTAVVAGLRLGEAFGRDAGDPPLLYLLYSSPLACFSVLGPMVVWFSAMLAKGGGSMRVALAATATGTAVWSGANLLLSLGFGVFPIPFSLITCTSPALFASMAVVVAMNRAEVFGRNGVTRNLLGSSCALAVAAAHAYILLFYIGHFASAGVGTQNAMVACLPLIRYSVKVAVKKLTVMGGVGCDFAHGAGFFTDVQANVVSCILFTRAIDSWETFALTVVLDAILKLGYITRLMWVVIEEQRGVIVALSEAIDKTVADETAATAGGFSERGSIFLRAAFREVRSNSPYVMNSSSPSSSSARTRTSSAALVSPAQTTPPPADAGVVSDEGSAPDGLADDHAHFKSNPRMEWLLANCYFAMLAEMSAPLCMAGATYVLFLSENWDSVTFIAVAVHQNTLYLGLGLALLQAIVDIVGFLLLVTILRRALRIDPIQVGVFLISRNKLFFVTIHGCGVVYFVYNFLYQAGSDVSLEFRWLTNSTWRPPPL